MRVIRIFSKPVDPSKNTVIAQFNLCDVDLALAYYSSHKADKEYKAVWFESAHIG